MTTTSSTAPLWWRMFSIAPSGSDRTGFYVGVLPGQNVGSAVSGGPLVLEAGIPESFNVLMKEIQSLALDIRVQRREEG